MQQEMGGTLEKKKQNISSENMKLGRQRVCSLSHIEVGELLRLVNFLCCAASHTHTESV